MTRYRALAFGKPLAPWQATFELATQSAIEANGANREPGSGRVSLSPGVEIEESDGSVELTPDMALWTEALTIIRMHQHRAELFVGDEMRRLAGDAARRARLGMIRSRIIQIMEAANDAQQ